MRHRSWMYGRYLKAFRNGDDNYYKNGYDLSVFWNLLLKEADSLEIYEKMKNCILEEEEETQIFFADYSFFEAVTELTIVANRIVRKHFGVRPTNGII